MGKIFSLSLCCAVTILLSSCALLAPPDDVKGTLQLERHSKASIDALIIDGKTKAADIFAMFGAPAPAQNGATCRSNGKQECAVYVWAFNRINFADRQLSSRAVSIGVNKNTGVIDSHFYTGYDKPY